MQRWRIIKKLKKIIISCFLALQILNICSFLYDFKPQTFWKISETIPTGVTQRVKQVYTCIDEGFGFGITDEHGYINPHSFDDSTYDIVVMGSSHIQALQVTQKENLVGQLNNLFAKNGNKRNVYNLGLSGWTFNDSIRYINQVCETLEPTQYIFIELQDLNPHAIDLGNFAKGSKNEGGGKYLFIKDILFYQPFLRCIARIIQKNDFLLKKEKAEEYFNNDDVLQKLFNGFDKIANKYNINIGLLFHPTETIDNNGKIMISKDINEENQWVRLCDEHNIIWVDTSDEFIDVFERDNIIVYGFNNTAVCQGHLNSNGHKIVAAKIYNSILAYERKDKTY